MAIKERIEKIKKYFREMQIVSDEGGQMIYVVVEFPHNWVIDETIEEKFNVTVNEGNIIGEYYFATEMDNGEGNIFDAIEYNIEKMKEAIERAQLLQEKITEITNLFRDESISIKELRTLKISWKKIEDEEILIPQTPVSNAAVFTEGNETAAENFETVEKKHKKISKA